MHHALSPSSPVAEADPCPLNKSGRMAMAERSDAGGRSCGAVGRLCSQEPAPLLSSTPLNPLQARTNSLLSVGRTSASKLVEEPNTAWDTS